MYTRCPECLTCFRVTDRHLAIANGKVRCGQCQHIFNAPQHAIDEPLKQTEKTPQPAESKPANVSDRGAKQAAATTTTSPQSRAEITATAKPLPAAKKEAGVAHSSLNSGEVKTVKAGTEKPATIAPAFTPDATLITDLSSLKAEELSEINLDALPETKNKVAAEEHDDIFADDVDLNAVIEELTQANTKATAHKTTTLHPAVKQARHETNTDNIFSTDAYDATNASNIEDLFNEMEGQLSLNIDSSGSKQTDNPDNDFDFLILEEDELANKDDSNLTAEKSVTEKSIEEQFIDEFDLSEDNTEEKTIIDAEELFDQVDLSDFEDENSSEKTQSQKSPSDSKHSRAPAAEKNDIPFRLRKDIERLQAPQRRRWHPLFSILFILILLPLSFAQLAYFRSHELVKVIPESRPLLEVFCAKVHCVYSGPRDIKKIQMISRDVRLHPKEKNALLISAAMINQADFDQPYPDIHIRLSDISGNIVAERIFNAKTYMGKLSNPFLLMKSKTPVHINFEVVDPGKDAVNFEFTFQ